jgi:hypothetical protein
VNKQPGGSHIQDKTSQLVDFQSDNLGSAFLSRLPDYPLR